MIRVTKHPILWFDGRRRRTMRPGDVFQADPAVEDRWVAEGVAELVDERTEPAGDSSAPAAAEPTDAPEPDAAPAPAGGEPTEDGADDLERMTRDELVGILEGYGLKAGKKNKSQLVEAIREAERAPELTAAEVE